jgi:hypothetical protein
MHRVGANICPPQKLSKADTAISEASRKFAKELGTDEKLREVVERIKGRLKICVM